MCDSKVETGESSKKSQRQNSDDLPDDDLGSKKVYKKTSPNNKLVLYLCQRDLLVTDGKIDRLHGVLLLDNEYVSSQKIYGQITLTFRYGREDEEVMGLKFCNEAIMCLTQLYPPYPDYDMPTSPLQNALVKRLGSNAYPFTMEITPLAPPSVQLVPAKEYNGAPIGTCYDIRAYLAECTDEKLNRSSMVKMGIRVVQMPSLKQQILNLDCQQRRQQFRLFGKQDFSECSTYRMNLSKIQSEIIYYNTENDQTQQSQIQEKKLHEKKNRSLERTSTFLRPFFRSNFSDFEHTKKSIHNATSIAKQHERAATVNTEIGTSARFKNSADIIVKNRAIDNDADHETEKTGSESDDDEDNNNDFQATVTNEKLFKIKKHEINDENLTKRTEGVIALSEIPPPHATVDKPFLLSDGRVELQASLDKAIYKHGEPVQVQVTVHNNSNKSVRRIKIFIVQHVDVCMFTNGKFKNVVSFINSKEDCPISTGASITKTYSLKPARSQTKNWIALEDSYNRSGVNLASTITPQMNTAEERNVFSIYVSYYVKVKLLVSAMGGELSLKLPFISLPKIHDEDNDERVDSGDRNKPKNENKVELDLEDVKSKEDKGNS